MFPNSKAVLHEQAKNELEIPTIGSPFSEISKSLQVMPITQIASDVHNITQTLNKELPPLLKRMNSTMDTFDHILKENKNNTAKMVSELGNAAQNVGGAAQSFDLMVGDFKTRPDKAMGYAACEGAEKNNYQDGNFGAGTGASVGKLGDKSLCMKGGIGSYAVQIGDLKVGAIVAVNARGDIYDWKDGKKVAGLLNADRKTFADTEEAVYKSYEVVKNKFTGATENTTIGAVITNAAFPKSSLCKIAGMAHDGYARAIRPVHTSSDGDSIYALSVGDVKADQDMVGTLGAQVMAEAILRAVRSAESAYGLVGAKDL